MGDEIVAIDLELADSLGIACGDVGSIAGGLADELELLLGTARQSMRAAGLLGEVQRELATLSRVIVATVAGARAADRFVPGRPAWLRARIAVALADEALWRSLGDSEGAAAIDIGVFDLAAAFRTMGAAQWRSATIPSGCGSFGPGRYYRGGGALRGPDDRLYPIVVPHLVLDEDRHFTIDGDIDTGTPSVASLGGMDPGWTMIGYRTGVERIESEPAPGWKLLTGAAVATGLDLPAAVDPSHLVGVRLRAGSPARFSAEPDAVARVTPVGSASGSAVTVPEPTVWLTVDGRTAQYPISEVPDLALGPTGRATVPVAHRTSLGRVNTANRLLSLATGVAAGFVAAGDLDDSRHRAYEVMFEEHRDGRLRARVQTFTLERGPQGVGLYGWHLFLDAEGDLHESPTAYHLGASVHPPDLLLAGNRYDPDFTVRLPAAAFGGTTERP